MMNTIFASVIFVVSGIVIINSVVINKTAAALHSACTAKRVSCNNISIF